MEDALIEVAGTEKARPVDPFVAQLERLAFEAARQARALEKASRLDPEARRLFVASGHLFDVIHGLWYSRDENLAFPRPRSKAGLRRRRFRPKRRLTRTVPLYS